MEIIVSAFIGALSAITVAYINKKSGVKQKDKVVDEIVQQLKINSDNIYIIDSGKTQDIKYTSEASQDKTLIIIK